MGAAAFISTWRRVTVVEGGYVNNPADAGGPTNFGITEAVARAQGYTGDMKDLSEATASQIAKAEYWDSLKLDDISDISGPIAMELFDTGYNCGIDQSAKFLQAALNVFSGNDGQSKPLYADLVEDGVVGSVTVAALKAYMTEHAPMEGEQVMIAALNAQQGRLYMDICAAKQLDKQFVYGWFRTRVVVS